MAYPPLTGLFAERYLIERELGHGATAVVYLAHDNKHDREIALKVLSKDLAHALGPQRFLQEIHLTARLHHPHILPIFDSGEWNGMLFYVLPFVRGESLRQKLDREKQLPIEECVRITCEVADALSQAHSAGVIHRDVKPENIMLSDGHALLADFGIARVLDVHTGERLTSSGLIVGTSAYMSPEQAAGEEKIDARSDIYSLACVLYEMLAGVQAFTGPTTQSVIAQRFKHKPRPVTAYRSEVPEYLEQALEKALAIAPADRYRKIKDFSADLPDVPSASRDRRRSPIRRTIQEKQKAFGFAAAAVVIATAAFVAVNPPGNWRSPFARHVALDSTKYVVIPSPAPGEAGIGERDFEAASRFDREMQKWSGVTIVDPQVIKDAVADNQIKQSGDAFDFAKRYGAGRLVRINSAGDASLYDVATGNVLNDLSSEDVKAANDVYAATLINLLGPRERPKAAVGGDGLTTSMPAWLAYGQAHVRLANWDVDGAQNLFRAASKFDPAFAAAHLWSAVISEWISADTLSWRDDAIRAASSAGTLAPRDRTLALALAALARREYPAACAQYHKLIEADSLDVIGWYGYAECQAMDPAVLPSPRSPSGFAFRSSYKGAVAAYSRALSLEPRAFVLMDRTEIEQLLPTVSTKLRTGSGITSPQPFVAYPTIDHDTIAFVPYDLVAFSNLPISALASRSAALENNAQTLLALATRWVRAIPSSAAALETLADVLEARGEIDASNQQAFTASTALNRAIQLTKRPEDRVRLRASEVRLRLKRGDYEGVARLADSLLSETSLSAETAINLAPLAAYTGRIRALAADPRAAHFRQPEGVVLGPQVMESAALFFAHAALGDCSQHTTEERARLEQRLASYVAESDRENVRRILESRALGMLSPCTGGRSALEIGSSGDRLTRMQQTFARGELAKVRQAFDSVVARRRLMRPGDLSFDYTYEESWLRAAMGDTAGAVRQLDLTLTAFPTVNAASLREAGSAAAVGRALLLRAELALKTHDTAAARKYAAAVAALWIHSDPELQPIVSRMKSVAAGH